jgi:hypothetical protein
MRSAATRNRRCAGSAAASGTSPRPRAARASKSARNWPAGCCAPWSTAVRPTARPARAFRPQSFAVESIRRWWERLGRARYPGASRLVITADCGGSNGARVRLWNRELQRFANETGLAVTVAHLPPGTSKWNRIEHRLFAYISQNWRGKPLLSHQVIIQLIGATTTDTGLTVTCDIDADSYPKGIKVSDAEMDAINIERHTFHGDWNYTIKPVPTQPPP